MSGTPDRRVGLSGVISAVERLARLAARLAKNLAHEHVPEQAQAARLLAEKLQLLVQDLITLLLYFGVGEVPTQAPASSQSRERLHEMEALAKQQASKGVAAEDIGLDRDRKTVSVEGVRCSLHRYPVLWALLLVLLSQEGEIATDGITGWLGTAEIRRFLAKELGRPVTKRAVISNVHRLRWTLSASGVNGFLLQSDGKGHYRFAVRRRPPGKS